MVLMSEILRLISTFFALKKKLISQLLLLLVVTSVRPQMYTLIVLLYKIFVIILSIWRILQVVLAAGCRKAELDSPARPTVQPSHIHDQWESLDACQYQMYFFLTAYIFKV